MAEMKKILGGKCAICGAEDQLQIDHIDPSTKRFSLSKGWGKPWLDILSELAKCQLLCRICHRNKTAGETSIKMKGQVRAKHGGHRMRYKYGCLCEECSAFHSHRMAERRKS